MKKAKENVVDRYAVLVMVLITKTHHLDYLLTVSQKSHYTIIANCIVTCELFVAVSCIRLT